MTPFLSSGFLTVTLLSLCLIIEGLAPQPAAAQRASELPSVQTPLPRSVRRAMRLWVSQRIEASPPEIAFKVPAREVRDTMCTMNATRIRCHEVIVGFECPTSVIVEVPGQGATQIPVNCTGPDANGDCDCDFPSSGY